MLRITDKNSYMKCDKYYMEFCTTHELDKEKIKTFQALGARNECWKFHGRKMTKKQGIL